MHIVKSFWTANMLIYTCQEQLHRIIPMLIYVTQDQK